MYHMTRMPMNIVGLCVLCNVLRVHYSTWYCTGNIRSSEFRGYSAQLYAPRVSSVRSTLYFVHCTYRFDCNWSYGGVTRHTDNDTTFYVYCTTSISYLGLLLCKMCRTCSGKGEVLEPLEFFSVPGSGIWKDAISILPTQLMP